MTQKETKLLETFKKYIYLLLEPGNASARMKHFNVAFLL